MGIGLVRLGIETGLGLVLDDTIARFAIVVSRCSGCESSAADVVQLTSERVGQVHSRQLGVSLISSAVRYSSWCSDLHVTYAAPSTNCSTKCSTKCSTN